MKIREKIDFTNKQNPESRFDIVRIEDIPQMQTKIHSSFHYHLLQFYALLFIKNGEGLHYIDFEKHKCAKGTILLIGKGQMHKFQESSNLKGYILLFHNDFITNILNTKEAFRIIQLFNSAIFKSITQLDRNEMLIISDKINNIKREYFDTNDNFSKSIIAGEVYTILSFLLRLIARNNNFSYNIKYIEKFVSFQALLEENVFQTTKVYDYAKALGVSTKTLNTISKTIIGEQAKKHINDYHLMRIKKILFDKSLSIKECAFQSGFEDVPNFYKFFKKHLNLTPKQFRRQFY